MTIPDPAGTPTTFHVVEHSVMAPELQAAHPEIRTYRGADATAAAITLDVTPMGFHAFVRRPDGVTWLVDPAYNRRGRGPGAVLRRALGAGDEHVRREASSRRAVDAVAPVAGRRLLDPRRDRVQADLPDGVPHGQHLRELLRHGNVFAEKSTMMARVNEVYNDDLAIEFVLITGTDTKLNLDTVEKMTSPNGPCGQSACFAARPRWTTAAATP